jgi:hypothetical protein
MNWAYLQISFLLTKNTILVRQKYHPRSSKVPFLFSKSATLELVFCKKSIRFCNFQFSFCYFRVKFCKFQVQNNANFRIKTTPFPNQERFSDKVKVIVLKSNDA